MSAAGTSHRYDEVSRAGTSHRYDEVSRAGTGQQYDEAGRAGEVLDPRRTAVVVFDLLECYRPAAEEAGVIGPVRRLVDTARERGAAIVWARADHRADGLDFARTLADVDNKHRPFGPGNPRPTRPPHGSGSPAYRTLAELGQRPEDYDVPKHRWSALHGTHLDTSLRARDADTLVVCGGSTHVGVAATVYAARDLDYQVVVARDGLTGRQPQRDFFADHVFPRVCRVRRIDEILAALGADEAVPAGEVKQAR